MAEYRLRIRGLDCADCAAKLERKITAQKGIEKCRVDFLQEACIYECAPELQEDSEQAIRQIIHTEEPDVTVEREESTGETAAGEEEEEEENRLPRLLTGAGILAAALFLSGTAQTVLILIAYIVLGYDILWKAVRNLVHGKLFDENFLMALATLAALSLKDYKEAVSVMLFYQVGEYFEDRAVEKSRSSISALMDIRPDYAFVRKNEEYVKMDPSDVAAGDIVRVRPGEKIPLDGVVLTGTSSLDTASLTGESKPRDVEPGDDAISGCVNQSGLLEIKVTKPYGQSTVAKILDLVENAQSRKAKSENFITKFARIYTPAVVISAVLLACVMPLLGYTIQEGIYRACTFLVISCPCALVISIPLSFFAGIGGMSSKGVLVKGSNVVETLAKVQNVVMDKTGTLTSGRFAVVKVLGSADAVRDAAYAEHSSNHPIAQGILDAYGRPVEESRISAVQEIPGRGLSVTVDGIPVLAGNEKLMRDHDIAVEKTDEPGTLVYVAKNGVYEGCLVLRDQLKPDAAEAVKRLHAAGKKVLLVSGDADAITALAAQQLGADGYYGECLPDEKVARVEEIRRGGVTAFVGDGVNDAPVLTAADLGIAMGALGSDAAVEAADVVIMDDAPSKISGAIQSADRILKIVHQNIYGAIAAKLLILVLSAFGLAGMWLAIFADVGVACLCILNSMRLLHVSGR